MINNFTLSKYTLATHHYHTLLTYSFSHNGFFHLLFNMVGLYFFGRFVENSFGSRTLLNLYVLGALIGALFIATERY
jgi:membrane associated rhomboid family serine protease